jgi:hypothetical protein
MFQIAECVNDTYVISHFLSQTIFFIIFVLSLPIDNQVIYKEI